MVDDRTELSLVFSEKTAQNRKYDKTTKCLLCVQNYL